VNLNVLTGCAVSGGSTIKIKIAISMPLSRRDAGVDASIAALAPFGFRARDAG